MGYQGPDLEKKAHAPLHLVQITEAFYLGKQRLHNLNGDDYENRYLEK